MIAAVTDAAGFGGAERYLVLLAEEIGEQFTFVVPDAADPILRQRLAAAGDVVGLPGLRRRPGPLTLRRLIRLLDGLPARAVHANLTDQGSGLAPLVAGHRCRHPVVATLHNAIPGRSPLREAVSRRMVRLADATIAVSANVAAWLSAAGASPELIHNGVRPVAQHPDARARLGLPATAFVVGGLGRLHRQKGWDVLCQAVADLQGRIDGLEAVVLGEGPERGALAAAPGCEAVRFAGYVADAPTLLAAFDVFVLPSRFEALPLAPMEAMLAGVPVVAADVGGIGEVVGDAGVLVPPEDSAALATAVADLAADPARRRELAGRGRDRAQHLFRADRMAAQTAAVYDRLAGVGT